MNKKYRFIINRIGYILLITCLLLSISGCKYKHKHKHKHKPLVVRSHVQYTIEKIINLPFEIRESSGLLYYDSLFWTFNDGDNIPVLYGIDIHTGCIDRELFITDVQKYDWEDISQDSSFIYVGDVGNNYGTRKNQCIIKIAKSQINSDSKQNITSQIIGYSYPDQNDFSANLHYTSFDCEALICLGDSIVLFTKDWINNISTVYQISKMPGEYNAAKIGTIDTQGLITGAEYNPTSSQLILTGHSNDIPFILFSRKFSLNRLKKQKFFKSYFNEFAGVKIEGITIKNDTIYLSSEGLKIKQAIYRVIEK